MPTKTKKRQPYVMTEADMKQAQLLLAQMSPLSDTPRPFIVSISISMFNEGTQITLLEQEAGQTKDDATIICGWDWQETPKLVKSMLDMMPFKSVVTDNADPFDDDPTWEMMAGWEDFAVNLMLQELLNIAPLFIVEEKE